MRSKLIPGKVRPISFTLVALVVIVTALVTNIVFTYIMSVRLENLENAPQTEESAEVEQMFDNEIKSAEIVYFANQTERQMVELTVMAEAGSEGLEGMEAVAQVILDRAVLWDMTPVEVVTQPYQFATYSGEVSEECRLAVSNVFDLGIRIFDENVTHFHSGEEPYWTASKECRGILRNHSFWY